MDGIKNVVLLRQTDTGSLHSISFYMEERATLVDEGGDPVVLPACCRLIAVWDGECRPEWVDRAMDQSELMMHAVHSAKFTGAAIKTTYDIRTAGRKYAVGETGEVPF